MQARVGDQLLAESGNTGLILEVLGPDGHPPYVVRWLRSGHIAMVSPGQYARVIAASTDSQIDDHCQSQSQG